MSFSFYYAKAAAAGYKGGLTEAPSAGSFCCAKFSADDTWYRVVVAAVHAQENNPRKQGPRRGGFGALAPEGGGTSVHKFFFFQRAFDALNECTHSRCHNAHKNTTLAKFLIHVKSFTGLKFQNFPGEHAPGPFSKSF